MFIFLVLTLFKFVFSFIVHIFLCCPTFLFSVVCAIIYMTEMIHTQRALFGRPTGRFPYNCVYVCIFSVLVVIFVGGKTSSKTHFGMKENFFQVYIRKMKSCEMEMKMEIVDSFWYTEIWYFMKISIRIGRKHHIIITHFDCMKYILFKSWASFSLSSYFDVWFFFHTHRE